MPSATVELQGRDKLAVRHSKRDTNLGVICNDRKEHQKMRLIYVPVRRVTRVALHSWLALLVLLTISLPVALPARAQSLDMVRARYKVTFTGLFAQDALAAGVAVPSGAGFSKMIGTFHNGDVSFWSEGAIASAGVQDLAESGGVTDFAAEINQAVRLRDARRPFEWVDRRIDGTRTKILYVEAPRRFPLVTLLAKIDPSPDCKRHRPASQWRVDARAHSKSLRLGCRNRGRLRFYRRQSRDRPPGHHQQPARGRRILQSTDRDGDIQSVSTADRDRRDS